MTTDNLYSQLVGEILREGNLREPARLGMPETIGIFGTNLRFKNVGQNFPLLTTKKMGVKNIITEALWFLNGDTNIKYLVENGCNIWNDDAYKYYKRLLEKSEARKHGVLNEESFLERVKKGRFDEEILHADGSIYTYGDLGKVYGKFWRGFNGTDQIANNLNGLLNEPFSRYHVVSAWSPSELSQCALPPCHILFQFYARRNDDPKTKFTLDINFYMRSIDTGLGLPYNIASYAVVLMIMAKKLGYKAGDVIFNGGDTHIYKDHIENLSEQITRRPFGSPKLILSDDIVNLGFNEIKAEHFLLEGYESHPAVKLELSVGV